MNFHNSHFVIKRRSGNLFHEAKNSLSRLDRNRPLRGRGRLKAGRRTKDWIKVRRELSTEFAARGITSCELKMEGCWGEGALGFAHGRKRRHLEGDELKTLTILACNPCHDKIECLLPEEMLTTVESVIANREKER